MAVALEKTIIAKYSMFKQKYFHNNIKQKWKTWTVYSS